MVANPASVLLDIRSDRVFGDPVPADPDETAVASANMVANSALGTVSEFSPSTIAASGFDVSVEIVSDVGSALALDTGLIPASPTR